MSAILAFLKLAWPYLLAAGVGGFAIHEADTIPYNRLQASLSSYKAQVADENAKAQKAAADALQEQIDKRLTTEANNEKVISQLTAERDSTAADRDFARRLLAAAQARPTAGRGPVPGAADQHGTTQGAKPSGDGSLAQDLGDAAGECRDAIQRLAALQTELIPQLKR
jgi:hypothetical protein